MTDPSCQLIINDLLHSRHWSSALQLSLSGKDVVVAREMVTSPLVVFVPVSGEVVLSDLTLYVERVRQLAVDISTSQVTIEQYSQSETNLVKSCDSASVPLKSDGLLESHDVSTPTSSSPRFLEDVTFDRDKCLRLHREIQERQFEYELKRETEERKRARIEEVRLGLIPDDEMFESGGADPQGEISAKSENSEKATPRAFVPDPTIDFYTSVMFAFHDSGTFSYFLAASGLAPPELCPEDSDDEKPFDIVQQEQRQAERKRKNAES